ncbi:MAG TPA: hypothetical protein VI603_16755, partial [Saprospiraceae bacterium]|nr:hypothetical protein [Saprospiraceae bacterium]
MLGSQRLPFKIGQQTILQALLVGCATSCCFAQNLVPNPSFEEYTECPFGINQGEPLQCIPWVKGNGGTTDYLNVCNSPLNAGVPTNYWGYQWPVSGDAYVGLKSRDLDDDREYALAPLNAPLLADSTYLVTFYISTAEEYCYIKTIGALFTIDPPDYEPCNEEDCGFLDYSPQIEVNGEFLDDYENWVRISRCFVAEGGERYITIGNFRNNEETVYDPDCALGGDYIYFAYYYLDSMSVIKLQSSFDQFILDEAMACGSYEIDPGPAENYLWSDGTTNPTLTVTESGTYYITLSNECAFSYGEIDVTIIPDAPPVALPNDTLLCSGESLEISLDPDAGIYEWNDQSSNSDYTITEEGMYIVTLTDDCDMTSDTINVSFLDPPAQFSLGEDTLICDGDAFTISFDPSLGVFEWQDQSDDAFYTIEDDGTYSLTISNMCGEASDEIEVEFVQPIVFNLGPDQMTLCDGEEVEIELDPALGDFLWHDDIEGNSYTITGEGLVSVTVSNACYTETDEMLVSVLYQPEFTLGPDITVCSGQFPITLNLSDVEHAQSWEWTGGSTQSIYLVTGPGTFSVTISNDCFAMSDEIVISVGDVDPVVTLPDDQLLCPGQMFVLDVGGLMGSYQWATSTGSVSDADTFLVTEPGTYYLTVTNVCGSGSDSVTINYVQALSPPDLGADFSLCPGETGVLYANVDDVLYLWTDVSTGSTSGADSLIIIGPGTYALQISDACSTASDTIVIISNANPPDVDLPDTLDLCQGDSIVVEAGITGVQYLWEDGTQLSSVIVNA